MGLTLQEFEVVAYLHRYGAASPKELFRKLEAISPGSLATTIQSLIDKKYIEQLGTCVSSTTATAQKALAPYRVRRAIILAAGAGERMLPATKTVPKPMVKVYGKYIIETQLDALIAAGITDITIVRGHNGLVFDELKNKYKTITFVDNFHALTTNNIVSTSLVADRLSNAYIIEGDLYIQNPGIIRAHEYRSHYCGIRKEVEQDWYFVTDESRITHVDFGATQGNSQYVGISFWADKDAEILKQDIADALSKPDGDQLFLEAVPLVIHKDHYEIHLRELEQTDVVELDTYEELQSLDPTYKTTQAS